MKKRQKVNRMVKKAHLLLRTRRAGRRGWTVWQRKGPVIVTRAWRATAQPWRSHQWISYQKMAKRMNIALFYVF